MDPIILGIINSLMPALAVLAVASIPLGIVWLNKSHQLRMKELEIDAQRLGGASAAQLAGIEARLSAIEAALQLPPPQNALAGRAALLEGPATTGAQQGQPAGLRQR